MKQHLSICAGKAGYTFSFDNGKIVHYQDHYKNFGDLPFQSIMILKQQLVEYF